MLHPSPSTSPSPWQSFPRPLRCPAGLRAASAASGCRPAVRAMASGTTLPLPQQRWGALRASSEATRMSALDPPSTVAETAPREPMARLRPPQPAASVGRPRPPARLRCDGARRSWRQARPRAWWTAHAPGQPRLRVVMGRWSWFGAASPARRRRSPTHRASRPSSSHRCEGLMTVQSAPVVRAGCRERESRGRREVAAMAVELNLTGCSSQRGLHAGTIRPPPLCALRASPA